MEAEALRPPPDYLEWSAAWPCGYWQQTTTHQQALWCASDSLLEVREDLEELFVAESLSLLFVESSEFGRQVQLVAS